MSNNDADNIKEFSVGTINIELDRLTEKHIALRYNNHFSGPEELIKSHLNIACEQALRSAKRDLSVLAWPVDIDSELHYEYKGVKFAVEILRCRWDAIFVVRCAFSE